MLNIPLHAIDFDHDEGLVNIKIRAHKIQNIIIDGSSGVNVMVGYIQPMYVGTNQSTTSQVDIMNG
jgi:hypothetical protein